MKPFYYLLITVCCISASCRQQAEQYHPDWSADAVIYEVNVRQYTPEGTFNAFTEHLPRLKDLCVDILWIMPMHPIGELERKGSLGSYYAIKDYTAVNSEFGSLDDFKAMVNKAHELGFKVIIDWVANHTSPDAVWTVNKDWYITDSLGNFVIEYDWTDIAKLNYNNNDMRRAMIDAMLYWIKETHIDGFRCDVAGNVPVDFWEAALIELKAVKSDVFMLAEAEEPPLQQKAFNMYYAWHLHSEMNKIAQGLADANELRHVLELMNQRFPAYTIPMMFTSNHDENSWHGTEFERMGTAARAFAALTYLLPGMPLIYNGQEAGFNRRLAFFEKDEIDWTDQEDYTAFYRDLNKLRKNNPALHSQDKGGPLVEIKNSVPNAVFSFEREVKGNKVTAVFNLTDKEHSVAFESDYSKLKAIDALTPWEYKIFVQ
ncbi:MAG: alpha-amylase family glycosyl hydrolase [Bacteroidales bacterium]|nr:alpha-amylase family glycosyl hydrolase [Bacteroidales bacterium]MCL2133121.1 alpha-amylase family glycosyl hydrolase [Bacteroidales bacterium]